MNETIKSTWKIVVVIATLGGFFAALKLVFDLSQPPPEDRALAGALQVGAARATEGAPSKLDRLKETNASLLEALVPIWLGHVEAEEGRESLAESDLVSASVSEFDDAWKASSECLLKGECRPENLQNECEDALNYFGELATLVAFRHYSTGEPSELRDLLDQVPSTHRSAVACSSEYEAIEAAKNVAAGYLDYFYEEAVSRLDHQTIARLAELPEELLKGLMRPISFVQAASDAEHAPFLDLANRICRTVADFTSGRDYAALSHDFQARNPENQFGKPYQNFLRITVGDRRWSMIRESLRYVYQEGDEQWNDQTAATTLIRHCKALNTFAPESFYEPMEFLLFNHDGACERLAGLRSQSAEIHLFLCHSYGDVVYPQNVNQTLTIMVRRWR